MPAAPSLRAHRRRFCITPRWRKPTLGNRIVLTDVDAGYGAVRVLHRVSIEVGEGETVALLGTNGNGKSTLMKCIMGLVPVDAGEVFVEIDGQRIDLRGKSPEAVVNLGIALVPEGRRLFPKLTVEENLLLGAYRTEARKSMANNLRFCFEAFPILHQRRRQLAESMSGRATDAGHYACPHVSPENSLG